MLMVQLLTRHWKKKTKTKTVPSCRFRNWISYSQLMPKISSGPPKWLPGGSLQHLKCYSTSQHYTEHRWKPTMPSSLVHFWLFHPDTVSKLWDSGILHECESDKSNWLLDSSLQVASLSLRNSEMGESVEQNEIMWNCAMHIMSKRKNQPFKIKAHNVKMGLYNPTFRKWCWRLTGFSLVKKCLTVQGKDCNCLHRNYSLWFDYIVQK